MITRPDVEALDRSDPLAPYRDHFAHPADSERIYVDGNSLGVASRVAVAAITNTVEAWRERQVGGWDEWINLPLDAGNALAPLIGARPGEVVACDSVTVNLFKVAAAWLRDRPGRIAVPRGEFPTDRYVLSGLGRNLVWLDGELTADAVRALPPDVALVVGSVVDYRSGARADVEAVTAAAPCAVLWDLCHAVGSVEIDLAAAGAQLAVGCTYKYIGAGPGAPAFIYVREAEQAALIPPIQGWFGQADQFAMGDDYAPAPGITRFLTGTPPIVSLSAIPPAAALLAEAGMPAVAAKGRALTELAIDLYDRWLADLGFELGTPRDAAARGAHVALRHPDAWPLCRALIELAGVLPDFRRPDVLRFGFPALTTRFVDVYDSLDRLRALVASGDWQAVDPAARAVT